MEDFSRPSNPIDRVEQQVEIVSGVPTTLWSRTLWEGEVLAVHYTAATGFDQGSGAVAGSMLQTSFVANYPVGGPPDVTVDPDETPVFGTIPGGSVTVDLDGAEVRVRVTYSETGTLYYSDSTRLLVTHVVPH